MRRNEASLFAFADRDTRNQRLAVEAAFGNIPPRLFNKAQDHQDQLTEAERQRLLSCGHVVGKALAYPDSLTTDEIHEACGWPTPDVVRANIQRATSGRLRTPAELCTKAKDALVSHPRGHGLDRRRLDARHVHQGLFRGWISARRLQRQPSDVSLRRPRITQLLPALHVAMHHRRHLAVRSSRGRDAQCAVRVGRMLRRLSARHGLGRAQHHGRD
jgi:hypothetical protein